MERGAPAVPAAYAAPVAAYSPLPNGPTAMAVTVAAGACTGRLWLVDGGGQEDGNENAHIVQGVCHGWNPKVVLGQHVRRAENHAEHHELQETWTRTNASATAMLERVGEGLLRGTDRRKKNAETPARPHFLMPAVAPALEPRQRAGTCSDRAAPSCVMWLPAYAAEEIRICRGGQRGQDSVRARHTEPLTRSDGRAIRPPIGQGRAGTLTAGNAPILGDRLCSTMPR